MLSALCCLTLLSTLLSPCLLALESHSKGDITINSSLIELLGEQAAVKLKEVMPSDEVINWQVYVPETYDPKVPAGVLVYISPTPSGQIPPDWKSLMDKHNLIWIAADHSGNRETTIRRMYYALLGSNIIKSKYSTTKNRLYLSGFSGGGRVASILAWEHPHIFKGAIYNSGVNFWNEKEPANLQQLQNNRFVFITGKSDGNLDDTKRVYRKYKAAGVKNIKLMINMRQGHSNPRKSSYEKAIIFLDNEH